MFKKKIIAGLLLLIFLFAIPSPALSQTYYFSLDKEIVNAYWEKDGTLSIDYVFIFSNSTSADPIDYVDVGFPNEHFDIANVSADVDGLTITDIDTSPYVDNGVALGLGSHAIQPGDTGKVHLYIKGITHVLYTDSKNKEYASAVFAPTWFGDEYVYGTTDLTVVFHLPPGVKPEEPKWHKAPDGFPQTPETYLDKHGRVVYAWHNPQANGHSTYKFGASFPKTYVPKTAIVTPGFFETLGISKDTIFGCTCWGSVLAMFAFFAWLGKTTSKKRKLQYLPPKLSIEGHGIKRGLTAVEAAILMEHPVDKILTMILFSVIKKNAAKVIAKEPLKIKTTEPRPAGLRKYEIDFLEAFDEKSPARRKKKLQALIIDLIKSVSKKMKGFSRKETIAYYEKIMDKAWQQIKAADTPEVKSKKYDEYMGWTMLDKDFEDRTKDVFSQGPVFVPVWWNRYDPGWHGSPATSSSQPSTSGSGGSFSMPTLPGSTFAASVVTGLQNFSSNVVGDITSFTSGITEKTNPAPVSSSSGGYHGGGGGCACACACAGCACACAGGGR